MTDEEEIIEVPLTHTHTLIHSYWSQALCLVGHQRADGGA